MRDDRLRRMSRELFMAAFGFPGVVDDWLVERVTSVLEERTVRTGEPVYKEGEAPAWIHLMDEGRVRMSRRKGPSWTLEGHWVMGSYEAIREVPRVTSALAETDLQLMRMPTSAWLEILEDSFELTRGSIAIGARSAANLECRLADLPAADGTARRVRRTSSLVEKLAFLLDVEFVRGAGVQALADFAALTREDTFDSRQVVLERGIERDLLVFVVDGEVTADRTGPDLVRTYGYGQVICGPACFGQWSTPWRAVAKVPTRTLSVPIEAAFDAMEEHFDLARSVLAALAVHRQRVVEQLASEVKDLVLR